MMDDISSSTATEMENLKTEWGNRFIISAIIQGGIITAIALVTVGVQLFFTKVNIIQFLSLSFEGPAKWFFIGTIFYLILVVAIAVTAGFYNHLQINLKRRFSGISKVLAWIHLICMNVGGVGATMLMIFAGLSGSGVLSIFAEGNIGNENIMIMTSFIFPIASFIGVLCIGVISGGLAYTITYKQKI
jgi:hypothetical protein